MCVGNWCVGERGLVIPLLICMWVGNWCVGVCGEVGNWCVGVCRLFNESIGACGLVTGVLVCL